MKYFFISIVFALNIYAIEYLKNINEQYKLDFIDSAKSYLNTLFEDELKYKSIFYNKGLTGIDLVCGKMQKDSKDNRFIYISDEFTFVENITKDFVLIWEQLCKYDNREEEYYRIAQPLIPL